MGDQKFLVTHSFQGKFWDFYDISPILGHLPVLLNFRTTLGFQDGWEVRDSLCFETEEDFYEIMLKHKEFFDLSNFPKNSKIFCNDNKKIPEKMKDEYRGTAIFEYA